jgi:hypothetical protein
MLERNKSLSNTADELMEKFVPLAHAGKVVVHTRRESPYGCDEHSVLLQPRVDVIDGHGGEVRGAKSLDNFRRRIITYGSNDGALLANEHILNHPIY